MRLIGQAAAGVRATGRSRRRRVERERLARQQLLLDRQEAGLQHCPRLSAAADRAWEHHRVCRPAQPCRPSQSEEAQIKRSQRGLVWERLQAKRAALTHSGAKLCMRDAVDTRCRIALLREEIQRRHSQVAADSEICVHVRFINCLVRVLTASSRRGEPVVEIPIRVRSNVTVHTLEQLLRDHIANLIRSGGYFGLLLGSSTADNALNALRAFAFGEPRVALRLLHCDGRISPLYTADGAGQHMTLADNALGAAASEGHVPTLLLEPV